MLRKWKQKNLMSVSDQWLRAGNFESVHSQCCMRLDAYTGQQHQSLWAIWSRNSTTFKECLEPRGGLIQHLAKINRKLKVWAPEQVVQWSWGFWFESPAPPAACQCILEQDTEPQIAPDEQLVPCMAACVCVNVCVNGWMWQVVSRDFSGH